MAMIITSVMVVLDMVVVVDMLAMLDAVVFTSLNFCVTLSPIGQNDKAIWIDSTKMKTNIFKNTKTTFLVKGLC